MFMLDLLDNTPRLRLSDDHMKAIIWTMKESGTPNVPSFYALRKMQSKLAREFGLQPRHHTSSLDNQFYMNHPNDLIRLDFSNPLVRNHLHFYPEITTTISESWQAAKWVDEIEDDDLSPMWANWEGASHRHFYVKELAQCNNGKFCVPLKWIVWGEQVHCDAYLVTREPSGIFTVEQHSIIRVLATDLRYDFLDLQQQAEIIFSGVQNAFKPHTPHPIRTTAQGKPVFVLRIMPWADDVSGNRSKQYNAHMNIYFANLNLPHKLLSQEYFVRFSATSQHASSSEQFDALAGDWLTNSDSKIGWTAAYDCKLQQEVLFRIGIHLLPADNPQQAESTSTAGSGASFWCREDDSGGSAPGKTRKPEETVEKIKEQIKTACLGVESKVDELQSASGVKDKTVVHWIGLLIARAREVQRQRVYDHNTRDPRLSDTKIKGPARAAIKLSILTEIQEELYTWILHTILLGEDKYIWHETTKLWTDEQGPLFAGRLQSASLDGLNLPSLRSRYMVQYKNSLIGKHFKALQQLSIFQLDLRLCSPALFELWKANGILGALIWFPEIKNMAQYLSDLTISINIVLDRWAIVDPTRITQKYKLHVLPHTPSAVYRFGPAPLFQTEIFECWNSVFRLCSVLSNHQAPSLDIASTLADMDGGWWKPGDGDWMQAGREIRRFLISSKQLQRRLGWTPDHLFTPGTVKVLSKAKRQSETWRIALGLSWDGQAEPIEHKGENWHGCKYVVARSEDPCFYASWVFFSEGTAVSLHLSTKILVPETHHSATEAVIAVQRFMISDTTDVHYNMPLLIDLHKTVFVKPEHDCQHFSCLLIDSPGPRQERSESRHTQKMRSHVDDSRFLLNLHGLHNAHVI
ncbi:hypothetical protein C8F04DRAFT_1307008 [Mycena alexandri]|uniref:Uncharacterized protein n=1 Tax=Mycena alexandri TaxID=1745969 RepID=A0AAD6S8R4_9AGAR|nr:hypothetical protein C8F04DRAFT_1307008 [Mycena alexandri]